MNSFLYALYLAFVPWKVARMVETKLLENAPREQLPNPPTRINRKSQGIDYAQLERERTDRDTWLKEHRPELLSEFQRHDEALREKLAEYEVLEVLGDGDCLEWRFAKKECEHFLLGTNNERIVFLNSVKSKRDACRILKDYLRR